MLKRVILTALNLILLSTRNAKHEETATFIHYYHQKFWRTTFSIRASRLGVRNTGSVNSSRVVASRPISSYTLD